MENHYLLQMVSHLCTGSKIVQLNMEIYYVELLHSCGGDLLLQVV